MFDMHKVYPVAPVSPAAIGTSGGRGEPGAIGPQGPASASGVGTLEGAARLKSDGKVETSNGFEKINRAAAGTYDLILSQTIPQEQTVILATLLNSFDPQPMMLFPTAAMGSDNKTVRIKIFDTGSKAQDAGFSVAVFRVAK